MVRSQRPTSRDHRAAARAAVPRQREVSRFQRRSVARYALGIGLVAVVWIAAGAAIAAQTYATSPSNPIATENQQPGQRLLSKSGFDAMRATFSGGEDGAPPSATNRAGLAPTAAAATSSWVAAPISGYAGADSINKGQSLDLFVSTTAPTFSLDVYRVGY
jgi:hypothetical protein